MRMIRVLALAVIAAMSTVTSVVIMAAPAQACSCAGASEAEYFQRADVVFTGELIDRQEPPSRPVMSSGDPATLTFEVSSVHKGEAHRLQQVETAVSGASCGLEIQGRGPFVVFADEARGGAMLTASLCGGTRAIADGGPPSYGADNPPAQGGSIPHDDPSGTGTSALVVGTTAGGALALAGWILLRHRRLQTRSQLKSPATSGP